MLPPACDLICFHQPVTWYAPTSLCLDMLPPACDLICSHQPVSWYVSTSLWLVAWQRCLNIVISLTHFHIINSSIYRSIDWFDFNSTSHIKAEILSQLSFCHSEQTLHNTANQKVVHLLTYLLTSLALYWHMLCQLCGSRVVKGTCCLASSCCFSVSSSASDTCYTDTQTQKKCSVCKISKNQIPPGLLCHLMTRYFIVTANCSLLGAHVLIVMGAL